MSQVLSTSRPSAADGRIPLLDIGPYLAGEPGARSELARAVERTCRDTGFLVISNHGIDQTLIDNTFATAAAFFDRPPEWKTRFKVGGLNIGYLPYGAQIIRTSKVHANTQPNLSESFYIVNDLSPRDPRIVSGDPLYGLNKWPDEMAAFKTTTLAYMSAMRPLAAKMVSVIGTSLGLPDDYFVAAFGEPTTTLRLIRYPGHESAADNQFGFAPHIDTNFLTLLARSALPGLEVRTTDGEWIRPPNVPNTFVVNTGEMLGRYSNDRYIATPHRVINDSKLLRHAIPFFFGPGLDAIVEPVATCVTADNPAKYEPLLYADHRRKLNITNFDHRRT
jgi:isopenicillin N synthase-like dioxygenase